jgi:hypothetical protein
MRLKREADRQRNVLGVGATAKCVFVFLCVWELENRSLGGWGRWRKEGDGCSVFLKHFTF